MPAAPLRAAETTRILLRISGICQGIMKCALNRSRAAARVTILALWKPRPCAYLRSALRHDALTVGRVRRAGAVAPGCRPLPASHSALGQLRPNPRAEPVCACVARLSVPCSRHACPRSRAHRRAGTHAGLGARFLRAPPAPAPRRSSGAELHLPGAWAPAGTVDDVCFVLPHFRRPAGARTPFTLPKPCSPARPGRRGREPETLPL